MVANTDHEERLSSLIRTTLSLCKQKSRTPEEIQEVINGLRGFLHMEPQPLSDELGIRAVQIENQWQVVKSLCNKVNNLATDLEKLLNCLQEFKDAASCQKQRQIIPEQVNPTKCPLCNAQLPDGDTYCGNNCKSNGQLSGYGPGR